MISMYAGTETLRTTFGVVAGCRSSAEMLQIRYRYGPQICGLTRPAITVSTAMAVLASWAMMSGVASFVRLPSSVQVR
jgi:hypothetical protein